MKITNPLLGENRYTSCGFCFLSNANASNLKIYSDISKKRHSSCYCTHNLIIFLIFLLVISNWNTQKISTMYPNSEDYFVQSSRIVRTLSKNKYFQYKINIPANTDQTRRAMDHGICNTIVVLSTFFGLKNTLYPPINDVLDVLK